jgi:phage protein D
MTQFRQPCLQVLADGVVLPGALAAEITSTNHVAADRFSARLAISADPQGLSAWDTRTAALIEVQIGFANTGWTSLITGAVDSLAADPIDGVLTIEGRDLSAGLIEARTQEAFANQTASDIAILLAGRQGLAAQVSPTSTPVGRYYSAGHDRLTLDRFARASTEWDLLAWLAQQENFDLFVSGTTLFFQPMVTDPTPAMVLQASANGALAPNITALRVQRAMTLAGNLSVTVKSWNSQQQTAFSETAQRTAGSGAARSYIYMRPNLSPQAAQTMAQQRLAALTAHELVLTATMPGELTLAPRTAVSLAGTNSVFDQTYVIDEIIRRFDLRGGFAQTVRGRTANQATL